jgi:hypothetical protein
MPFEIKTFVRSLLPIYSDWLVASSQSGFWASLHKVAGKPRVEAGFMWQTGTKEGGEFVAIL